MLSSAYNMMATSSFYDRSVSLTDAPECTICSERYDDIDEDLIPRNLACGHSLCSKCIVSCMRHNGQNTEGGISMICPSKCKQQTVIPEGNVQNLPKNFAVLDIIGARPERSASFSSTRSRSISVSSRSQLQVSSASSTSNTGEYNCDVCETSSATIVCPSCAVCLCESCSDDIHCRKGYQVHLLVPVGEFMDSLENLSSDSQLSPGNSKTEMFDDQQKTCKVHQSEPLEYYCEQCCEEICKQCHMIGDHQDHECGLLNDVAMERREALRQMMDKVNQCQVEWNKGFDECHEGREHLYTKQRDLEGVIKSHFHGIHSTLHAKEEYLLAVVRSEIESRSRALNSQADLLAKMCCIAKELAEECDDLLKGSNSETVRHADHLLAQAQQYVMSEQDTNPVVTDCIEADFRCEDELLHLAEGLGQMQMAPGRVLDLQVKATAANELMLSWKPPTDAHTFIAECASGSGQYRVIYEGQSLECIVEGCASEEDIVHRFRVAAMNDVGLGPYSMSITYTQRKASFLWDANLKHSKARISNNGYTVSIGENATWVSVGTNIILSHGRHYWEVVLDRYGSPSMSRKVVIGVVSSTYHHWHRSHGVIGIKTCPIGNRSWGVACGTAKKLSSGGIFLSSIGRRHDLFREGDAVGVLLDLTEHNLSFYKNGEPLGMQFTDVYGPVIPAISFCRNKTLTLRFPPMPEHNNTFPVITVKERAPSPDPKTEKQRAGSV